MIKQIKTICISMGMLLLTSTSFAQKEWTHIKNVGANKQISVELNIPKGFTKIEVYGTDQSLISCKFVDDSGLETKLQGKVHKCVGALTHKTTKKITVVVINESSKQEEIIIKQITD